MCCSGTVAHVSPDVCDIGKNSTDQSTSNWFVSIFKFSTLKHAMVEINLKKLALGVVVTLMGNGHYTDMKFPGN